MKCLTHPIIIYCAFLLIELNAQSPIDFSDKQNAEIVQLGKEAEYGRCYVKCINQEEFVPSTEQVLIVPDSNKYANLEPIYEIRQEEIIIKKASFELMVEPPVFETVLDSILVIEACKYRGIYETMTERIQTRAEAGEWTFPSQEKIGKHDCLSDKINPVECQVVCWKKIYPKYETVVRKVLKSIDSTELKETKAEYKVVEKKRLKTPAILKIIEIPAEYETVNKQVVVAYKNGEEIIEPQYTTIPKMKPIAGPWPENDLEWREVVCDVKINQDLIKNIQQALKDRGYYNGPINGIQGGATNSALRKFQIDNNITGTGHNIGKILKLLGVY